jgi:hypothetical protein
MQRATADRNAGDGGGGLSGGQAGCLAEIRDGIAPGRVMLLTGAPGAGKSRIVAALSREPPEGVEVIVHGFWWRGLDVIETFEKAIRSHASPGGGGAGTFLLVCDAADSIDPQAIAGLAEWVRRGAREGRRLAGLVVGAQLPTGPFADVVVTVPPLTRAELAAIVRARATQHGGDPTGPSVAECAALHEATEGNPRRLTAQLMLARTRGIAQPPAPRNAEPRPAAEEPPPPPNPGADRPAKAPVRRRPAAMAIGLAGLLLLTGAGLLALRAVPDAEQAPEALATVATPVREAVATQPRAGSTELGDRLFQRMLAGHGVLLRDHAAVSPAGLPPGPPGTDAIFALQGPLRPEPIRAMLWRGLTGHVVQPRSQDFSVVIRGQAERLHVAYPELGCEGVLEPVPGQPGALLFRERLLETGACAGAGWLQVAPVDPRTLGIRWSARAEGPWTPLVPLAPLLEDDARAVPARLDLARFWRVTPVEVRRDPRDAEAGLSLSRQDRRDVQQRLDLAGFDPGAADGIFGPATRTAITSWQRAEGLRATGYLDASQLGLLRERTESALAERLASEPEPGRRVIRSTRQYVPCPVGTYRLGCWNPGKPDSADR